MEWTYSTFILLVKILYINVKFYISCPLRVYIINSSYCPTERVAGKIFNTFGTFGILFFVPWLPLSDSIRHFFFMSQWMLGLQIVCHMCQHRLTTLTDFICQNENKMNWHIPLVCTLHPSSIHPPLRWFGNIGQHTFWEYNGIITKIKKERKKEKII